MSSRLSTSSAAARFLSGKRKPREGASDCHQLQAQSLSRRDTGTKHQPVNVNHLCHLCLLPVYQPSVTEEVDREDSAGQSGSPHLGSPCLPVNSGSGLTRVAVSRLQ